MSTASQVLRLESSTLVSEPRPDTGIGMGASPARLYDSRCDYIFFLPTSTPCFWVFISNHFFFFVGGTVETHLSSISVPWRVVGGGSKSRLGLRLKVNPEEG